MVERLDFSALADQAVMQSGHAYMRPVIEKELLHYDILFGLDKAALLDDLTFQGGTALRLCYGGNRLSEDLDFAGGVDFSRDQLEGIKACLEDYLGDRYGLEVNVREPKPNNVSKEGMHTTRVTTWQLSIVTAPARPDIPMQRIKLQVANIPAYSRVPRALNINYDFLPDGYADTLVMTETPEELMADKMVSLVNTQRYVRYRDIWDLRWLKQKGIEPNLEWIAHKISDYEVNDYSSKVRDFMRRSRSIIYDPRFSQEMSRFLTQATLDRTLYKPQFQDFLVSEMNELFSQVTDLSA